MASVIHAGATLLTVLAVTACATDFGSVSGSPGTTFGKIYVDTPEVYTRERLVNDRFQQDAWLRDKLREKHTQGLQGSAGTSTQTNTAFALSAGLQAPTATKEQVEKPGKAQEVDDTPIEQFRDSLTYREEVRNEILENQLDDRHDIAGNTLYRLKFDATVVPLNDTSAYAMVEVTISGSSVWNMRADGKKRQVPEDAQFRRDAVEGPTYIALPDWEFASYVPDLDERTIGLYSRAYQDWVRDTDPGHYSMEEMLYGPLQRYFSVNDSEEPYGIEIKENCENYISEEDRSIARKEVIALGVPPEYLQAQTYTEEMRDGDYVEFTIYRRLCIQTGLANFIADLRDNKPTIYTYAVTPKERVQRVSGETLSAGSVGVSVGAEQSGVGATLAHSNAREARANAIMRQPQVVGYSPKAYRSGEATLGWLIGPRYKISSDPEGLVSFRHVPAQHTLTGIISVPSWWTELNLVTKVYWLDENGVEFTENGQKLNPGMDAATGKVTTIALPADLTSIADIFDPKRREPKLREPNTGKLEELRACEPGTVVIRGSQLWRSTVVTLGAQQADSISVLPNMKGVIATFNSVEPSISGSKDLYLWTSEGERYVRTIAIPSECKTAPAS